MKRFITATLASAFLAGCGGSHTSPVLPQTQAGTGSGTMSVTISIPPSTASSTARQAMYVSPSTAGVEILVAPAGTNFASPTTFEFATSRSDSNCHAGSPNPNYLQCSEKISVTAGSWDVRANLYDKGPLDSTHSQGNLLSRGDKLGVSVSVLNTTNITITALGQPTHAIACANYSAKQWSYRDTGGTAVDRVGIYSGTLSAQSGVWPSVDNAAVLCAYAVDADGNPITDLPAGYTIAFTSGSAALSTSNVAQGSSVGPQGVASKPFYAEGDVDRTKLTAYPNPGTPSYTVQLMNGASPVGATDTSSVAVVETDAQGGVTMPPSSSVTVHVTGSAHFAKLEMQGSSNPSGLSVAPVSPDVNGNAQENGSPLAFTITSGTAVGDYDVLFKELPDGVDPYEQDWTQAAVTATIHVKVDSAASFPVVIP